MRTILTIILIILCWNQSILSQNESVVDTIHVVGLSKEDIEELKAPIGNIEALETESALKSDIFELKPDTEFKDLLTPPAGSELPSSLLIRKQDIVGEYPLPHWETGYVYGTSYAQADFLYGYMTAANAGVRQSLGRNWTAQAEIGLQKHSVYYNTATASGQVTWHPSPYFALTAFGAYSPGSFMSPVKIGQSFQWGGYVTLQSDTSIPFGVDLGVRQTYDYMFGHEAVPIVQPFIKIGGSKIGIDLGPMLKEATRKHHGDDGGFNAIPQPMKVMPPVAPRR